MHVRRIALLLFQDQQRGRELADLLKADGMEAIVSGNSDNFSRYVNQQLVDLILLENDLDGFLGGLDIVERLHRDLLHPTTVLIGNLTAGQQRRARELQINTILRADVALESIRGVVQGLMTISKAALIVTPQAARRLVQGADVVKPLPELLVKLSDYLDHKNASIRDLAQDISCDPRATAELLKVVNSSALGLPHKVTRLFDAVNFLGIHRTVSLVLSSGVLNAQGQLLNKLPHPIRKWYNQRSILIASTAAAFGNRLEQISTDTAYVLGLLQDLGVLVLAQAFSQRYQLLLNRVREIGHLQLDLAEKLEFKINHADVSAALLQKWEMPHAIVSMVLDHHARDSTPSRSESEQKFLHVMRIGEAFANLTDVNAPQRQQVLRQLLEKYGGAHADECRACLAEAVARTIESCRIFAIPVPDDAVLQAILQKCSEAVSHSGEVVEAAPPAAVSTAVGKLLVVDDEDSIIELVRMYLRSSAVEVVGCRSVAQARLCAGQATAMLCDVHLGEELGIDAVRQLRQGGYAGPVIMISGDRTRATVQNAIEAGINDYLLKPFTASTLLQKLRQHTALLAEPLSITAPV